MARQGYRKGDETSKDVKQSFKKLGISNEDGWNADMRKRYFKMAAKAHEILEKSDYTNLEIREKELGSRDVKRTDVKVSGGANLQAKGIWSDNVFDSVKSRIEQLIKYTLEKEEEKKRSGEKYKKIINLHEIKHTHTRDFIHDKLGAGEISVASANKYFGDLKKFDEIAAAYGQTNSKEGKFLKESTRQKIKEEYGPKSKENRVRSLKSDGSYGHSLADARKLIESASDIRVKTAIQALTYQGYRKETLFKLQWKDVVDENNRISDDTFIEDAQKMKSGRVQLVETNDKDYKLNLEFMKSKKTSNEDYVFGKNDDGKGFSPYQLEKEIKKLCDETDVEWAGYHAFRSATVEYYREEKLPKMTKEEVVHGILKMVNVEVPGPDGKMYKPHNPKVDKTEIVRDENGEPLRRKNKHGGTYIVRRKVLGDDGKPIKVDKYTYENLIRSRRDYLENVYIAEQISHNRPDANQPYENHKKK